MTQKITIKAICMIMITAVILTGCMGEQGMTGDEPQPVTGGGIAVSTPEPTPTPKEEREIIAVIKTISKEGILFTPYIEDDPLWDIAETFFIKNENLKILKDGISSIYDMVYFYDGMVIKFTGDFEEKTDYSILVPENGTQVEINLVPQYKAFKEASSNNNETPINIVNNDSSKADTEFDGIFCKFSMPQRYGKKVTIDYNVNQETHDGSIDIIYKQKKIFTITKDKYKDGEKLAEANGYVYSIKKEYLDYMAGKKTRKTYKKIHDLIKKKFQIVNY